MIVSFFCQVLEMKQANSIYNEQEFHARKIIKIPVHQHGALWEKFGNGTGTVKLNIDKQLSLPSSHSEGSLRQMRERLMYKADAEFNSNDTAPVQNEDYDDDNDDFDGGNGAGENKWLLSNDSKETTMKGTTSNICEEYLELVDKDIQHVSKRVQSKTDIVDIGATALAYMQPNEADANSSAMLGPAGWITYKGILLCVCTVGVILPVMYVIYFLFFNKKR